MRRIVASLVASALVCASVPAPAQNPPKPPSGAPEPAKPDAAKPSASEADDAAGSPPVDEASAAREVELKKEARARFEKGLKLIQESAWTAALAEFLASRELYPTRGNTKNAALCLRKLQRYDEALALYEVLLRDFAGLPADEKAAAQREITELRSLVGTIEIEDAEPGATIVVDGQARADFPLVTPLRVPAGSHIVRVFKQGYEPFETRVDVAGGQRATVRARLQALTESGTLRVAERSGKALEVLVDGAVVGTTPWEGPLAVGDHVVILRGEGTVGTQPASARITNRTRTTLTLAAEDLPSSLVVEVTPPGAFVSIDSVGVGRGVWSGRLRAGRHVLEVAQEGFVAARRNVTLAPGQREIVQVQLERDESAAIWQKPSRVVVDADAAFGLAPSFGGDVAGACDGDCSRGVGIGILAMARATYELGSGIGFGLGAGYLLAQQSVDERQAPITPQGLAPRPGTASDELRLTGFLAGVHGSIRFSDRFPFLVRLGAGGLFGQVRDVRMATIAGGGGVSSFETPEHGDRASATYLFVAPEVRGGVKITERFELSAGVTVPILVALTQPRWGESDDLAVVVPGQGYSKYDNDALTGDVFVLFAPGLGARYAF